MPTTPSKKPGRPRTRPPGGKKRAVYLTDPEFAELAAEAAAAGVSTEEYTRRVLLARRRR